MNTEGKRGRDHPSWKARVAPWLPSLGLVYWITAIGYVLYSDVTDTGLMGHLFAFEVHTLGFANDVLNLLLVMFAVSFVPPMLLVGAVGRWQRPDATPPAKSLKAKIVHPGVLQRLPVFKPILALLVIGLAGAFIHARNLQVYDIDLGAFPIPLAPRAAFLVLKAIPASQFRSGYFSTYPKGGVRVNTYQPLVGPGWAPDQPIHYFLYETSHDLSFAADWRGRTPAMEVPAAVPYDAAQIAPEFDASHLQAVHGKIVGRLPTIVAQDYDAKGFVVAPDYIVIAPIRMQGHEVAFFDRYENFLVPALLIVGLPVALFVGGCMVWLVGALWRGVKPKATPKKSVSTTANANRLTRSVGIMTAGEVFSEIIAANTPLPTTYSNAFGNALDNQPAIAIAIAQRAEADTEAVTAIVVDQLPARPKGQLNIVLTISIDAQRQLRVKATVPESGYLKEWGPFSVR